MRNALCVDIVSGSSSTRSRQRTNMTLVDTTSATRTW
jgi:hypothetical protein